MSERNPRINEKLSKKKNDDNAKRTHSRCCCYSVKAFKSNVRARAYLCFLSASNPSEFTEKNRGSKMYVGTSSAASEEERHCFKASCKVKLSCTRKSFRCHKTTLFLIVLFVWPSFDDDDIFAINLLFFLLLSPSSSRESANARRLPETDGREEETTRTLAAGRRQMPTERFRTEGREEDVMVIRGRKCALYPKKSNDFSCSRDLKDDTITTIWDIRHNSQSYMCITNVIKSKTTTLCRLSLRIDTRRFVSTCGIFCARRRRRRP